MLILTRNVSQKIIIGENIEVQVLDVRGNQVRIGIKAPPEISIHREEIKFIIDKEKAKANAY